MQEIVHNINLNLSQPNNFEYIHIMQGDYNTEKVIVTLFNGNKLYTVDAQKACLQGSTSNGGLILQDNLEISTDKHQVTFDITKEMSSCTGELKCNIVFSSDNQKKSTFPFIIKNTADITGRAPVSVLTTISDYVDRAEKAASDAEKTLNDKADKDHKHTKSDITDFPTLGTASAKDVASSGNATTTQVVMGNDTRLTNARNASDVYAWAKSSVKPSYSKSEVGLGNVDNTSDANKPVSTAQQTAIDTAYTNANKYTDKKVAELIGSAPETMDTLEEVAAAIQENKDVETALNAAIGTKANQTELDTHTGNSTIHITASERTKWNAAKTHADSTHARTDATKVEKSTTNGNIKINGTETTVYTHPSGTNPHGTTKSDVGLGNVGNFKAVSTVANQGLTDTEKSNARTNIGAGTSSFSGSYNDLTNKPTIPTVGNGTITIKQAGTSKGTFTMNQTGNTTIELTDNNTTYGVATSSALGLVKSGTDITVDSNGNVSVNDDSHNHVISNVDGLQNALNGKQNIRNGLVTGAVDWNTLVTPGSYKIQGSTMTTDYHAPVGEYQFGILFVIDSEGDTNEHRVLQLYFPHNPSKFPIWYRMNNSQDGYDKWTEWNGISRDADTLDGNHASAFAAASHTHSYAGSSSAGGSATSAVKLDSSAGSATQPVYFSGGKPVACSYILGKSVPSNAVFTDTVYDDTEIMDKIDAILDPDNEVVEGQTVTTYDPGFVVGKTLSYTTGEVEDNAQYIAALNYTKIADGATYRMTTSASSTFRLIVYDSNKKIVKAWNQGTDGAWRDNGGEFTLPTGMDIKYIRCYSETTTIPTVFDIVNVSTNASIFKIVSGGATRFSKLAFKNQYALKPYAIDDDPNMHGLKILRDNDCNEEFSIVEIAAPSKTPYESTLTLMNSGEKTVQFVDFSSMRYDESTQGTIELVCQSRGANTPLPEFRINFNNGDGHGRVQKFVVRPDALPIKMTSKGLLVRKNNDYTNESTDDDWYEFNFKDVLNNIEAKADKSETTVNLLNPTLQTTTKNGVTCTNNGDGTYTVSTDKNGATANSEFFLTNFLDNIYQGKNFIGCPSGGSDSTYILNFGFYDSNKTWIDFSGDIGNGSIIKELSKCPYILPYISIKSGTVCDNLVFKPMITTNLNATYDDFVPYTGDSGSLNCDVADLRENVDNLVELGEDITD